MFKKLSNHFFPTYGEKNIQLYYFLTFFSNGWFVMAIWLFFWQKFMNGSLLGITEAAAFAIGLVAEIPSGAIADLLGKRNTVLLSRILLVITNVFYAFAGDWKLLFIGTSIFAISESFFSGAAEALLYDSLKEKNKEKHFDTISGRVNMLSLMTTICCGALGGYLYVINDRLPFILWGFFGTIATLITFFMTEPKIDTQKFSFNSYIAQMKDGWKHLFQKSLQPYLLMFFAISGIYYIHSFGFIRPAMGQLFGMQPEQLSIVITVVMSLSAVIVFQFDKLRKRIPDFWGIGIIAVIMASGYLLAAGFTHFIVGVGILFLIQVSGNLSSSWISVVINKEIASSHRATTLSTLAFITKLPYVVVAIFAGVLLEKQLLPVYFVITGIILVGTVVLSLRFRAAALRK